MIADGAETVVFELDASALTQKVLPSHKPIPRQQAASRDLALIVNEKVTHQALMQAIAEADTAGLVRDATLFDIYRPKAASSDIGAHERSLAVRLELLDEANTLTDERIESATKSAIETLGARLGARLRG